MNLHIYMFIYREREKLPDGDHLQSWGTFTFQNPCVYVWYFTISLYHSCSQKKEKSIKIYIFLNVKLFIKQRKT